MGKRGERGKEKGVDRVRTLKPFMAVMFVDENIIYRCANRSEGQGPQKSMGEIETERDSGGGRDYRAAHFSEFPSAAADTWAARWGKS